MISSVVPGLFGDIVLFADARQRFDRGTLRALVANFADPTVGAVSGELVLTTAEGTTAAGHGTAFYWRYETFIRASEGRVDSTVGATTRRKSFSTRKENPYYKSSKSLYREYKKYYD